MISYAIIVRGTDKNHKSQCALSGMDIYSCYTGASKKNPTKKTDENRVVPFYFCNLRGAQVMMK